MSRKLNRRALLALGAGLGSLPAPGRAAPRTTVLRIGYITSIDAHFGKGALALAARLSEATDGRIRVEQYPSSEAGADVELLQSLRRGSIDLAFNSTLSGLVRDIGIFDIPFLFRDLAHARAVLDGPVGAAALRSLEPHGIIGLAWGENGLRHLTTTTRIVRSPADMAGLKLRVPQSEVIAAAFRGLGCDPAPLPFSELYAALASGRFEAQENPISNIEGARLQTVQKNLILTGHVYSPGAVLASRHAFARLSATDQEALRRAAAEGAAVSRRASEESAREGVARLRSQGMQVIDVDRAAFAAALAGVEPTFAAMFGKDRIAAIRDTRS